MAKLLPQIKKILLRIFGRETLIFIFFLLLSAAFWLMLEMNDSFEKEIPVLVRITNVPKNVMLTSDDVDTIMVTVHDKGITLAYYLFEPSVKTITARFETYAKTNGTGVISSQELKRITAKQFASSTTITSIKPEHLTFYYNYGLRKKLPVRWTGRVIPENMYFISRSEAVPDSVVIYASKEKLDSMTYATTEALNYVGFRDTLRIDCQMEKITGVKFVPSTVKYIFYTDVLTEEHMSNIPIVAENMPEGKILRTFPGHASVSFVTGVKNLHNIGPADFVVAVDYREIARHSTDKCTLHLRSAPQGISNVKLDSEQLDYLIEDK